MTARWVVDEVAPERDLKILWQPISLLEKNQPDPDSDYYGPVARTHGLLRVMESLRAADGDDAVFPLYWEYGRRIHHDRDRDFDPTEALKAIGADEAHAAAMDDESWDTVIRERMGQGLALSGDDVGTPLIAFDNDDGEKVALFGPVITRVPSREQSLRLWDGFVMMATTPGFWEVKRTRTERPEFGERP
ncbi:MAG: disulfide bond formation protein DsbA [Actinomycetota bacterium]